MEDEDSFDADAEVEKGGGEYVNGHTMYVSDDEAEEEEPTPRKPSIGKLSAKSRDTLTPLEEPPDDLVTKDVTSSNGSVKTNDYNTGEQLTSKSDDHVDPRIQKFSSTSEPSRSQRSSTEQAPHSAVFSETPEEERRKSSKSGSNSEGKAVWENPPEEDKGKSSLSTDESTTGASALKDRFEKPISQSPSQGNRLTTSMSRSGSISGSDTDGEPVKSNVSASAILARFEQKASATTPPKRNFVINKGANSVGNKFNQANQSNKCQVCGKTVYAMEKLEIEGKAFHKACFKCETCKRSLSAGNYASLQGKFYCKPHLKQLFQLKGNYDEGFGREQRKADWDKKGAPAPSIPSKISKQTPPPPAAPQVDEPVATDPVEDESPKDDDVAEDVVTEVPDNDDNDENNE